ncbi:MAG: hypothetical protein IJ995_02180 [Clostridia bacterium]|nr:hypothetical protein [Clostridia bacterium]
MKKFLAIFLLFILSISLTACGNDAQENMINDAVEELKSEWEDIYDDSRVETDGYFEIKNTRVIEIKRNDIEEFEDVDYIIEFLLYTDYFGSSPYYSYSGTSDSVIVYDNGDMEVSSTNLLRWYSTKHYTFDYSDIIKTVNDYGDNFNCVENLK